MGMGEGKQAYRILDDLKIFCKDSFKAFITSPDFCCSVGWESFCKLAGLIPR